MRFQYEITADEYVSASVLQWKLSGGRSRIRSAVTWILAGLSFIVIAWSEHVLNWSPTLLAGVGAWWFYAGVSNLFPAWHFRRAYPRSGLAGKRYTADLSEDGFEVSGDLCSWRVRWPGVGLRGENKRVFMLDSVGVIFIFGKKYLNDEQQQELRRLIELVPSDTT